MEDTISRQALLNKFEPWLKVKDYNDGELNMLKAILYEIRFMPSVRSETFEWCTNCKEYDQEAHCCHRWSKMIRKTVDEMQIVRCKDCKYAEYIDDVKTLWCTECGQGRTVASYDFCSYGERREDG